MRTGNDSWLSSKVCCQLTGKRKPHSFAEYNSHISAVETLAPDRGEQPPLLLSQNVRSQENTKALGNSTSGFSPTEKQDRTTTTINSWLLFFFLDNNSNTNR